ncbi:hypothetical protein FBQ97_09535 [Acidobacteria bacterium ACD]|nr:hypothetical protein [Acidobacteria bacterium ACD]
MPNTAKRRPQPGEMISVQLMTGDLSVGADGTVTSVRLLTGGKPECQDAVATAVRARRFQPALDAEGRPVPGRVGLSLTFR